MELDQLKQSAEALITQEIHDAQAAYFELNGKYEQVIKDISKLEEDQVETVIDEYIGTFQQEVGGYIIRSYLKKDGKLYLKSEDSRSERSHDWTEVISPLGRI